MRMKLAVEKAVILSSGQTGAHWVVLGDISQSRRVVDSQVLRGGL